MIDWNSFNTTFQYNAITEAIRGTPKEKLYQELGLESLRLPRCYKKHFLFYKIFKNQNPEYLFHLIPVRRLHAQQRMCATFPFLNQNIILSKTLFFPSTISEWNKLDPNSAYNCQANGIKLAMRLCLGLNHLREHKFKHNF